MSEDIKQDLPDDDDDIIELVDVVEQGKEKEADDKLGFSADLEAIIDGMEEKEDGVDAAFPDPNPVDYEVDHNESLDIPSMDDLDNLLESLGAEENALERQSQVVDSNGDDLDAADEVELEDIPDILKDDAGESSLANTDRGTVSAALDKALSEKGGSGDREEDPKGRAAESEADEVLDIDELMGFEAFEEDQTGVKEESPAKAEESKIQDLDPFEAALLAAEGSADLRAEGEEKLEEILELSEESGEAEKDKGELDPFEAALAKAGAVKDEAKSKAADFEEILKESQKNIPEAEKTVQEEKASIPAVDADHLPIDTEDLPMAAREEAEVFAEESTVPEQLEPVADPFEAAQNLAASKDISEKALIKEAAEGKAQDDDKEEGAMRSRIDEDLNELDALLDDMLALSPAEKEQGEINAAAAASAAVSTQVSTNELKTDDDGLFMQEIYQLSDRINLLEQLNKSLASEVLELQNKAGKEEGSVSSEGDIGEKFAELQAALDKEKEKNESFRADVEILLDENKKINEEMEKLVAETAARVIREEISALLKDLQDED